VQAERAPTGVITQSGSRSFRRTWLPKSSAELHQLRAQMAYEALDMVDPDLHVYPNPSPSHCGVCAFRAPCIATNAGSGVAEIFASSYRQVSEEVVEEGRLGGVSWSMNRGAAPPRFGPERGPSPRTAGGPRQSQERPDSEGGRST